MRCRAQIKRFINKTMLAVPYMKPDFLRSRAQDFDCHAHATDIYWTIFARSMRSLCEFRVLVCMMCSALKFTHTLLAAAFPYRVPSARSLQSLCAPICREYASSFKYIIYILMQRATRAHVTCVNRCAYCSASNRYFNARLCIHRERRRSGSACEPRTTPNADSHPSRRRRRLC